MNKKSQTTKRIEIISMILLVIYSLLRALPVATLGKYGVNAWIFLAIDLLTTVPYVLGTSAMVRAKTISAIYKNATVALLSFLAPYIYLIVAGGSDMPILAWIIIGVYISGAAFLSVRRIRKNRRPTSVNTHNP